MLRKLLKIILCKHQLLNNKKGSFQLKRAFFIIRQIDLKIKLKMDNLLGGNYLYITHLDLGKQNFLQTR